MGFAEHVEAIAAFVFGVLSTAGAALWRAAVWTERMKNLIRENREASDARHASAEEASDIRHKAILDKLEDIQTENDRAHEATKREMDQLRSEVKEDRDETRAMRKEARDAAAALSVRIDSVFARLT
jgi:hypothetical protein